MLQAQMRNHTVDVLKAIPLFAALDQTELDSLAACAGRRGYPPGEILFSEGEPCAGLFIVVTGSVRIFKTSPNGREQVLSIDGPGSSIAELPVFDGGPYPASAAATQNSELLFISRKDFRAICLQHPDVALKVLQVVGARLRRLVGIIEELSFTTVRHRLISWILRQARSEGRNTGRGLAFTLHISHQELAAQIGTVRELVSRNIARLQAQGFVEVNGREVTVLDAEGLEADLASVV
jgi:CRP/FNR family transcriptional regulator, cyclic AMP receptor protein